MLSNKAGLAAAPAAFVVLWASGFIGAKFGLPYAEPLTFLSIRMAGAVLLLGSIALTTRAPWPGGTAVLHSIGTGILVHGVYLAGVFVSIEHGLPTGLSALVVGLQPILTSTLAKLLLRERVMPRQWLGLLLGLLGLYLVVQDKTTGVATSFAGWAAAAVALVGITLGTLYQKRFGSAIDWRSGMLIQYAAAGLLLALGAAALETRVVHLTPQFLFALCWLIFVLSLGAVWLLYFLLRRTTAARVTSLFYLTPPVTALMGWAIFGERLPPLVLAGMAVSAGGVFLVNWRVERSAQEPG